MFFQRAKIGLNETWRYIVGSFLILIGWLSISSAPVVVLYIYIAIKGGTVTGDIANDALSVGLGKNIALLSMLSTFVLACLCIYFVVKYFHKKPFMSIITSRYTFSWKRAGFGFLVWFLLAMIPFYFSYQQSPEDYTFSFNPTTFIPLLLICIFILPFQTSFEELLMRGYGMQGVGLTTQSSLLALIIPAVIFGLLHSANPEVMEYGFYKMMPFYVGMGLFLGIMTIMDNGLEMAIGVHFANNFTAAVFVNMENSALATDALFMAKSYNPTKDIPYAVATMVIFLILAHLTFKWGNWNKLIRKIK
ncbi:hypothetical protein C7377_0148 [Balneicella halophila]|uniref:CAAX prenyl protease 2/Lysostaphin resistance protein A-like domain-containing protein n=1 Tax=Balneicella halophila TaxID=1537566 RepID=A0A7L4URK2_BALHA|nr:CPBP family intramembrane glutamic endopeptidase [Balneicella halophila]PVX51857.1 hypothetical protein C7377_0148 [Balneicella halophila]